MELKKLKLENRNSLEAGDVLIRNKSAFGLIDHYGLYIGNGKVIDNHPDRGVTMLALESFLNGRELNRVDRFAGDYWSRRQVVQKGISMIGMEYHLTDFNCEHFVNVARGSAKKSQQVTAMGIFLLFFVIIFGLNRA
ncbi:lecithin retinol acyltransferase family protein [Echinicola marina]|uniref:lecithin retinol acyltransferase family protein n=1 Tax=Echinicola marina TaxID=2859768 RepID=UPI001CF609D9|nr:lecithin retinol acyltransferase family protein [Echinicola marina]UCS93278.1 lecithin retinol acyltransferase family protein [Echinicola marina]